MLRQRVLHKNPELLRGPGGKAPGVFFPPELVAGLNYFLDVEIGRTTCTKSQPNLASCPFHVQPHLRKEALCSFQVYTVPWLGKTSLVKSNCQDA
ncbi:Cystatin-C [Myotis brandtii]|uniref:Cystatin-C n=1 Tax=Myotis brandtii TaxID=109478 RepID=S7NYH3_MYOBR|nr:Cystatin-C [Myotis brandtii]